MDKHEPPIHARLRVPFRLTTIVGALPAFLVLWRPQTIPGVEYEQARVISFAGATPALSSLISLGFWSSPKSNAPPTPQLGIAPIISSDGTSSELRVFGTF